MIVNAIETDAADRDQRQRAEPRADHEPARGLLRRGALPGRRQRRAADRTSATLPPQCAALNRTNINVQELAVRAALSGDREHVYHAVALDPLTGALLTLDQIRAMTDELFAAHAAFLRPLGWAPQ